MKETQIKNRLAGSQSPYLLQHANNPVDWFPWGEEAFAKAKREDKPVFLSIGYSTCHWCHVMEHESFEDQEVAGLMNETFISIKVDREERPDIDGIYMSVCQLLTGSGGWPLTIIMTPAKKPFFAGTYFPKQERFGRMGMIELIPKIKNLWLERREEILKSADEIVSMLNTSSLIMQQKPAEQKNHFSGVEIFERAYDELSSHYDEEFGGFGTSMKFPMPHNLIFLLRYWKRRKNEKAFRIAEQTFREMRKGGIYDHIGFGFCRYSTDREWLVPHFEKMLYDQALLAAAYTEMYAASGEEFYKQTAIEILEYVLSNMTSPEGGFYSAEDADSEGEEGKFYLWKKNEIEEILDENEVRFVNKIFNIKEEGNWFDQAHGRRDGSNIFHLPAGEGNYEKLIDELNINKTEFNSILESSREKLFEVREKRVHPFKDDKILTDWNGLMISAFAKAAQAFDINEYRTAAEKAAGFILNNLKDKKGNLLHRYRNGASGISATLDDYAFFISALLDLYETNFETIYLKEVLRLNKDLIEHFRDKENGGFFFTSDESEELILRQKEINDGAVPSGNSIAMLNLLRLSRITGNTLYEEMASEMEKSFSVLLMKAPSAFTQFLIALDYAAGPSTEIILSGDFAAEDIQEIKKVIFERYIPNKIILFSSSESREELIKIAPFIKNYNEADGKAAVYVCENYVCRLPVTKPGELKEILKNL